jgi:hemerythrin-like domain-containing protein
LPAVLPPNLTPSEARDVTGDSFRDAGVLPGGADGPLELLSRLHARTLRHCAMLRQLATHMAECGSDEEARRDARTLLHYFDIGPPQYHSDEEEDLFPALLESMAGSDPVCLRDLATTMAREHRTLESMWARLRKTLAAVAGGQEASLDGAEVEAFVALNQSHIEREETELLPMASRLLTDDALAQVRESMRERHRAPRDRDAGSGPA